MSRDNEFHDKVALVLGAVITGLAIIRPKPGGPSARKRPWS